MLRKTRSELFHTGENLAERHLAAKGYQILARNFRAPAGEIDIIAQTGDTLVFAEVKTRSRHSLRQALMNVSHTKQKRISQTAEQFYRQYPEYGEFRARFDILVVFYYETSGDYSVNHLEDAFIPVL